MSTTKVILAGAAGAVAVGAVLLWRRTQQAKEQGGSFCASVAQPLGRTVGFDIPPSMCGAVDALAGAVIGAVKDAATHADEDAENTRINGAVDVPLTEQARWLTRDGMSNLSGTSTFFKAATVLRYKNGCEPFEGAPGWKKCAPGTTSMRYTRPAFLVHPTTPKATTPAELQAGAVHVIDIAQLMTAGPSDPVTLLERFPDGSYIIAGKRHTCPSGQEPQVSRVTDHRTGQTTVKVTCAAPRGDSGWSELSGEERTTAIEDANRKGAPTSSTSGGGDVNDPSTWPPGYRWNGSHWERA